MKKCSYCKQTKSIEEFYRDNSRVDGRQYRCKECSLMIFTRRQTHRKLWNKKHPDSIRRSVERWHDKNPIKTAALKIYRAALQKGSLKRKPCMVCGEKKSHGHHADYSKPLSVVWLCPLHHKEVHRGRISI